jgi:3-oxoacyl-[acyl-carrier protein] reductase
MSFPRVVTFVDEKVEQLKGRSRESLAKAACRQLQAIPLGRFAKPSDVAAAALFLCSAEPEFLTGVVMEVDGGRTI